MEGLTDGGLVTHHVTGVTSPLWGGGSTEIGELAWAQKVL